MTTIDIPEIIVEPYYRDKIIPFATKVYGVLSLQLLVTVGVVCTVMFPEKNRQAILSNSLAALIVTFVFGIITMIVSLIYRSKISLLFFTASMSVMVSIPCAVYYEKGHGFLVLAAFVITLSLFVVLSVVGWIFGKHFRGIGQYLGGCLWILIIWGIINLIFGWNVNFVYSMLSALVFSLYVIYDTDKIISRHIMDGDYIVACIELYLDIINLFLDVLEILANTCGEEN